MFIDQLHATPQVYARADVEAAGAAIHVPRVEMGSRAKLSCVAWNSYIKGALLAADYDGGVTLWDAEAAACTALFEEHGKRVWSIDFSQVGFACWAGMRLMPAVLLAWRVSDAGLAAQRRC